MLYLTAMRASSLMSRSARSRLVRRRSSIMEMRLSAAAGSLEIEEEFMSKPKKRPSKSAKAAQKLLNDSKMLASAKAAANAGQEFKSSVETPRANTTAIKHRPEKKKG